MDSVTATLLDSARSGAHRGKGKGEEGKELAAGRLGGWRFTLPAMHCTCRVLTGGGAEAQCQRGSGLCPEGPGEKGKPGDQLEKRAVLVGRTRREQGGVENGNLCVPVKGCGYEADRHGLPGFPDQQRGPSEGS